MSLTTRLAAAAIFAATFAAAAEAQTIVDIAAGDDRFTTLVAAVTAAGLGLEVPARVLWFVVPAVVCIAALPVTPSGLGVREHLLVSLLALPEFPGVRHGEALALALLAYTANLAWSALGGVVYLFQPRQTTA